MRALSLALFLIAVPSCHETSCLCPSASLAFSVIDGATGRPIAGAQFTEGGVALAPLATTYACADGGGAPCSDYDFTLCEPTGQTSNCVADGDHTFAVTAPGYSTASIAAGVDHETDSVDSCSCLIAAAANSAQVDADDAPYPLTAIVTLTAAR